MFRMFKKFLYNKQIQKKKCYGSTKKFTRELINEISYTELLEKVKQGAKLIDVRTKQEFIEGHLDGAILIPYYDVSRKIENIIQNKDQTIIVYCQNGGRSIKAYKILNRLGYNNVYNLKGGKEGIN